MGDRRIKLSKDKEDLIKKLTKADSEDGPFSTRADLATFAAVLGFKRSNKLPFDDNLEPIRQDVFERRGYDIVINLLAISDTKDPLVLRNTDDEDNRRITIFEQYINGGLVELQRELKGAVDPLEQILLMINNEKEGTEDDGEFVLSRFL